MIARQPKATRSASDTMIDSVMYDVFERVGNSLSLVRTMIMQNNVMKQAIFISGCSQS